MMKLAKKEKQVAPEETDSESEEKCDSDDDDQHMSDEEYPMSEDDGTTTEEASKWAQTMAKFLKKSSDKPILSKVPKIADQVKKQAKKASYHFEVVGSGDAGAVAEPKKEKTTDEEKPDDVQIVRELLRQKALRKKQHRRDTLGLRLKPSIGEYERERTLKKVATKGTVQLFNAVRLQQQDVGKRLQEAGHLEYKREKVLKSLNKKEFLNKLMSGPRAKSEFVDNLVKEETKDEVKSEEDSDEGPQSTWGALRADFLTGKKSGWDKADEEEDKAFNDDDDDGIEGMESDSE